MYILIFQISLPVFSNPWGKFFHRASRETGFFRKEIESRLSRIFESFFVLLYGNRDPDLFKADDLFAGFYDIPVPGIS